MATPKRTPLAERFHSRVQRAGPDECWLWKGPTNGRRGYGYIGKGGRGGRPLLTHRVAWELAHGPIPDGQQVLHRCDNPQCVNVAHLFLGTQLDNVRDMIAKGRDALIGERHSLAKLTETIVREIRTSPETGRALARRLNVPFRTISNVRRRKSWKHVL